MCYSWQCCSTSVPVRVSTWATQVSSVVHSPVLSLLSLPSFTIAYIVYSMRIYTVHEVNAVYTVAHSAACPGSRKIVKFFFTKH